MSGADDSMFRASPLQAQLWRSLGGTPGLAACVLRADRTLDREAAAAALARLVERHTVLQTELRKLPSMSEPVQVFDENSETVPTVELSESTVEDVDTWTASRLVGEAWSRPPLLRAELGRHPDGDLFALTLPTLAADAASLEILAREFGVLYGGGEIDEDDEAFEYLNFSEWQHDLREGDDEDEDEDDGPSDLEAAAEFWQRAMPEPPSCRLFPGETHDGGAFALGTVPLEWTALDDATEDRLLAVWTALAERLGEPRDEAEAAPAIGWLADGREQDVLEHAVGLYARRLPLRLEPDGHQSVETLAHQVATTREESEEWGDLFDPPPTAFRDALGFRTVTWPETVPAGEALLRLLAWRAPHEPCLAELVLTRGQDGAVRRAELHYDAARWSTPVAEHLARLVETLTAVAQARPDAPFGSLDLTEKSRIETPDQPVTQEATAGESDTVPERLARQIAERPDATALITFDAALNPEEMTFAELGARVYPLARRLRELGVGPEVTVGLYLERSSDLIAGLLAIQVAGGAYVPMDPLYPAERLRTMLTTANARLVLSRQRLLDSTGEAFADLDTLGLDDADEVAAIGALDSTPLEVDIHPRHLAYVLFTSGSTGQPKGVMIEHGGLAHLAAALEDRLYQHLTDPHRDGALRVGLTAPLVFDASVKQWIQLLAGRTLVLVPEEVRPDPARYLALAEAVGLDVADTTPTQLGPLLDAGLGGPQTRPRHVFLGGEAIDERLWTRLAASTSVRFWNLYGPTECTVDATATAVDGERPILGDPLLGVGAAVCDRRGQPLPRGVAGELLVGGGGVARGYANAPARTAERFIPSVWNGAGTRLYRTGDRVRQTLNGAFEFLGRVDHQIKLRGLRLELGEIEAALRDHPAVRQAVVDVRPIDDESHLVAWVVLADEVSAEPTRDDPSAEIKSALRQRLPEFMVPGYLVPVGRLPQNRSGKVDRSALPDVTAAARQRVAYLAPRNPLEREIAEIWQKALGVDKVGAKDNFFDLGGHSLLLLQVFEELRQRYDAGLSMVEMFHFPTVNALAERLAGDGTKAEESLAKVDDRIAKQRQARARQRGRRRGR